MYPSYQERTEVLNVTNRENKGLISADRGTKPLSCLQYLVLYLSRIQRICLLPIFELVFSIAELL